MKRKIIDELRDSPLYTQKEAAQYLNVALSTLRYWAFGENTPIRVVNPTIKTSSDSRQLSFLNLVELHVLNSLRRDYKIVLPKIRKALDYTKTQLKVDRPLLQESFETDGIDLFVDRYGGLINVSKEGQQAMRAILKTSLQRIERDSKKIPMKLFPYTHSEFERSPKIICMTPTIFSGRPVIDGTRISTAVIADRYKAGDSVQDLAEDYELPPGNIEEALRCELEAA